MSERKSRVMLGAFLLSTSLGAQGDEGLTKAFDSTRSTAKAIHADGGGSQTLTLSPSSAPTAPACGHPASWDLAGVGFPVTFGARHERLADHLLVEAVPRSVSWAVELGLDPLHEGWTTLLSWPYWFRVPQVDPPGPEVTSTEPATAALGDEPLSLSELEGALLHTFRNRGGSGDPEGDAFKLIARTLGNLEASAETGGTPAGMRSSDGELYLSFRRLGGGKLRVRATHWQSGRDAQDSVILDVPPDGKTLVTASWGRRPSSPWEISVNGAPMPSIPFGHPLAVGLEVETVVGPPYVFRGSTSSADGVVLLSYQRCVHGRKP